MNAVTRSIVLATLLGTSYGLYADNAPTFHLKNNSADAIQLDIMQKGKSVLKRLESVKKNGAFSVHTLDTKQDTVLTIHFCPTADWCKTNRPKKFSVTIAGSSVRNRTIYIKFDGKKIDVQKGNSYGLTSKGYDMENNVTKADFRGATIN